MNVLLDRRKLGRFDGADAIPAGVIVGYTGERADLERVIGIYDPERGGVAIARGHLVRPVILAGRPPERYVPATVRAESAW